MRIPYVPTPYPDELIGSWLARTALHNGTGAWRTLLEQSGYGPWLFSRLVDLVDCTNPLERLLGSLGTTYERVLHQLTTLPYWLAFDATEKDSSWISGTTATPRIYATCGREKRWLSPIGQSRGTGEAKSAFFCPHCVDEDHETIGEPYWHRAHQLPNLFFCHKHYCRLLNACPKCKADFLRSKLTLIRALQLRCECGADLRLRVGREHPSDAQIRLIDVSVQALEHGATTWNFKHVRTYLKNALQGRTYVSTLASAFPKRVPWSINPNRVPTVPALKLRPMLCEARAPECAALLAALNIDFSVAAKSFATSILVDKKTAAPARRGDVMSIDVARRTFLQRAKLDRRKCRPNVPYLTAVWTLRLYDVEWFKKHCAAFSRYPLPRVHEDRQLLRELNGDASKSPAERRRMLKERGCYIRASLRDRPWLDRHLSMLRQELEEQKQINTQNVVADRARQVHEALATLASSDARPEMPTLRRLARITGLSAGQIRMAMKADPELRKASDTARDEKVALQLRWAARELVMSGIPLTKTAILYKAQLAARPKARRIAQDLVQADVQSRAIRPLV